MRSPVFVLKPEMGKRRNREEENEDEPDLNAGVAEYELGSDFEDEEIDSDTEAGLSNEEYLKYTKKQLAQSQNAETLFTLQSLEGGKEGEDDEDATIFLNASKLAHMEEDSDDETNEGITKKAHNKMIAEVTGRITKKKKKSTDASEWREEGVFNILADSEAVELSDLTENIAEAIGSNKIKEQLDAMTESKSRRVVPGLPKVVQERIERKTAYKQTKEEASKWQETVQLNRKLEVLSFPLEQEKDELPNAATITKKHQPRTDMEVEVAAILRSSGIEEKKIKEYEEFAMNKITPEEVKQRTAELAKLRALCFYAEIKARRQKKIKSKSYHRVLKRQKQKEQLTAEELKSTDPEYFKEMLRKREEDRIVERFTLKHKNTGNWAKRQLKRKDKSTMAEVQEQLRIGEELRRKMSKMSDSESDRENEEMHENGSEEPQNRNEVEKPAKGLFAMKFMARAAEKHTRTLKEAEEAEMQTNFASSDDEDESKEEASGRKAFAGAPLTFKNVHIPSEGPNAFSISNKKLNETNNRKTSSKKANELKFVEGETSSTTKATTKKKAGESTQEKAKDAISNEENPWLANDDPAPSKGAKKAAKNGANKAASDENKEKSNLSSTKHAQTIIDPELVMKIAEKDEEVDDQVDLLTQRKAVEEAFAGDNVVKQFAKKKKTLEEELEDIIDPNQPLPGWGSWVGLGAPKSNKRKHKVDQKKKKKENPIRKDAKLKRVIISEKQNKQMAKFCPTDVPYPFTSREQYEMTLRQPLGPQWNTIQAHRKLTKPEITKKVGIEIDPISKKVKNPKKEKKKAKLEAKRVDKTKKRE